MATSSRPSNQILDEMLVEIQEDRALQEQARVAKVARLRLARSAPRAESTASAPSVKKSPT